MSGEKLTRKYEKQIKEKGLGIMEEPKGLVTGTVAGFCEAIAGMGVRALRDGTIARTAREPQKKD